ncbi:MAG: FAD-dependent monooxygenase, partial [Alphaproteobacteria bacterium]
MSGGQDRDVIIVGAGPVGLISALDLSYRGIPVLVL